LTEQEIRKSIAALLERHAPALGGVRVVLFGSRARGFLFQPGQTPVQPGQISARAVCVIAA
jgi:hypothetical protein